MFSIEDIRNGGRVASDRLSGKLELTWTNKDQVLVSGGDGRYNYTWADPADLRAREVRLLNPVARHDAPDGRPAGSGLPEPTTDNLLVTGDAMHVLGAIAADPDLVDRYAGKVKLLYIDPPFNTGQTFEHYEDNLEHSIWLTMIRDRIRQVKPLLAPDASVWVHLDDAEVHRMRCVLDEVLGAGNFIAQVAWEKADSPNNSARYLSVDQDTILVYAIDRAQWSPNRLPRQAAYDSIYTNPDNDERGRWYPGDPFANKPYSLGLYTVMGPTGRAFAPPPGRFWRISEANFWRLDSEARIWWGPDGNARPSVKRFLSEVSGITPRTLWRHTEVGSNRTSKNEMRALFPGVTSFSTPKPERLIERVLLLGTDPGDLVLDFYAGSGTTAAVAHKMGRRWITCELSEQTLRDFTLPRLLSVIHGQDAGGITSSTSREAVDELPDGVTPDEAAKFTTLLGKFVGALTGDDKDAVSDPALAKALKALRAASRTRKVTVQQWYGGGGFTHLKVAPSMFETIEGMVFLADWARGGDLARAVAAQFGYRYDASDYPFTGSKGRKRLAVIDGTATPGIVQHIVGCLTPGQTVAIYATSLDPDALSVLPASCHLDKVPLAILESYRRGMRREKPINWAKEGE